MENADANTPSRDDDARNLAAEYLKRAATAVSDGDATLGMHLYLAAFEEEALLKETPSDEILSGLKKAWSLACARKERSLAEYILERMNPYLTDEESMSYMGQIQSLSLDGLAEAGCSVEELGELGEMIQSIAQSLLDLNPGAFSFGANDADDGGLSELAAAISGSAASSSGDAEEAPADVAPAASSAEDATGDAGEASSAAPKAEEASSGASGASDASDASKEAAPPKFGLRKTPASAGSSDPAADFLAKAAEEMGLGVAAEEEPLNYSTLAGYENAIRIMRDFGVGLQDDAEFQKFVGMLNRRHGLDRMPALDTLLFSSPAREDANRFVAATLGELKLPTLRMHMEENLQGMPLLCVTVESDKPVKLNVLRETFEQGGVLVLEDIDLWGPPVADMAEEPMNFIMAQLSRGAREAVNLIRSAVDNPDVYVLVTTAADAPIDDFFLDILEPLSVVDIDYPTPEERVDIWMDIARSHPSMRGVNRSDLVRFSANMPRFDMYMAAREALEEAYKVGLTSRRYQAVTRENLFDKLAAYQPLESQEYHELEEACVRDFRVDLAHLDDLLKDE